LKVLRILVKLDLGYSTLLEKVRVERAVQLMLDPDITLTDIAHEIGYTDSSNFSRALTDSNLRFTQPGQSAHGRKHRSEHMYKLDVIETTSPLDANSGKTWFRYVISNDKNFITGYRPGSEREIRRFADDCIATLNRKYPPVKIRTLNPARVNVNYLSRITHGMHRGWMQET